MGLKHYPRIEILSKKNKSAPISNLNEMYFASHTLVGLTTDTDTPFTYQWLVTPTLWWKLFFTKSYLSFINDLIIIDGNSYSTDTTKNILCVYTTSVFYNTKNLYYTYVAPTAPISSLTNLRCSSQWLEREISEFSTLCFLNLSDTRRLLTDYLTPKTTPRTHNVNDRMYTYNTEEVVFTL